MKVKSAQDVDQLLETLHDQGWEVEAKEVEEKTVPVHTTDEGVGSAASSVKVELELAKRYRNE